jgi:hypothetical protein
MILALRNAFLGETMARIELLDLAAIQRLEGDKNDVWTLQFCMMRLACMGISEAEQRRMRRLCLEAPVPIGLSEDRLRITLRLREYMLRALQAHQPASSSAHRLLEISRLTDLAATVHEPLRSQLLARGVELRSLLPKEALSRVQTPTRPQAEGKAGQG